MQLRQLAPCFDILVCLAIRLMIAYKLKTDGQLDFPFVHQGDPELLDATERSFAKLIKAHRPDLARESYNHDLWGRYHRRMTVLGVLVGSSATIGSAREHLRAEVIRLADGDPWHSCYITRGEAAPCDPGGVKDACGGVSKSRANVVDYAELTLFSVNAPVWNSALLQQRSTPDGHRREMKQYLTKIRFAANRASEGTLANPQEGMRGAELGRGSKRGLCKPGRGAQQQGSRANEPP